MRTLLGELNGSHRSHTLRSAGKSPWLLPHGAQPPAPAPNAGEVCGVTVGQGRTPGALWRIAVGGPRHYTERPLLLSPSVRTSAERARLLARSLLVRWATPGSGVVLREPPPGEEVKIWPLWNADGRVLTGTQVEGASFGGAFFLAWVSYYLGVPVAGDLIASVAIGPWGGLEPVGGIPSPGDPHDDGKLRVVETCALGVARLLVHESQRDQARDGLNAATAVARGNALQVRGVRTWFELFEAALEDPSRSLPPVTPTQAEASRNLVLAEESGRRALPTPEFKAPLDRIQRALVRSAKAKATVLMVAGPEGSGRASLLKAAACDPNVAARRYTILVSPTEGNVTEAQVHATMCVVHAAWPRALDEVKKDPREAWQKVLTAIAQRPAPDPTRVLLVLIDFDRWTAEALALLPPRGLAPAGGLPPVDFLLSHLDSYQDAWGDRLPKPRERWDFDRWSLRRALYGVPAAGAGAHTQRTPGDQEGWVRLALERRMLGSAAPGAGVEGLALAIAVAAGGRWLDARSITVAVTAGAPAALPPGPCGAGLPTLAFHDARANSGREDPYELERLVSARAMGLPAHEERLRKALLILAEAREPLDQTVFEWLLGEPSLQFTRHDLAELLGDGPWGLWAFADSTIARWLREAPLLPAWASARDRLRAELSARLGGALDGLRTRAPGKLTAWERYAVRHGFAHLKSADLDVTPYLAATLRWIGGAPARLSPGDLSDVLAACAAAHVQPVGLTEEQRGALFELAKGLSDSALAVEARVGAEHPLIDQLRAGATAALRVAWREAGASERDRRAYAFDLAEKLRWMALRVDGPARRELLEEAVQVLEQSWEISRWGTAYDTAWEAKAGAPPVWTAPNEAVARAMALATMHLALALGEGEAADNLLAISKGWEVLSWEYDATTDSLGPEDGVFYIEVGEGAARDVAAGGAGNWQGPRSCPSVRCNLAISSAMLRLWEKTRHGKECKGEMRIGSTNHGVATLYIAQLVFQARSLDALARLGRPDAVANGLDLWNRLVSGCGSSTPAGVGPEDWMKHECGVSHGDADIAVERVMDGIPVDVITLVAGLFAQALLDLGRFPESERHAQHALRSGSKIHAASTGESPRRFRPVWLGIAAKVLIKSLRLQGHHPEVRKATNFAARAVARRALPSWQSSNGEFCSNASHLTVGLCLGGAAAEGAALGLRIAAVLGGATGAGGTHDRGPTTARCGTSSIAEGAPASPRARSLTEDIEPLPRMGGDARIGRPGRLNGAHVSKRAPAYQVKQRITIDIGADWPRQVNYPEQWLESLWTLLGVALFPPTSLAYRATCSSMARELAVGGAELWVHRVERFTSLAGNFYASRSPSMGARADVLVRLAHPRATSARGRIILHGHGQAIITRAKYLPAEASRPGPHVHRSVAGTCGWFQWSEDVQHDHVQSAFDGAPALHAALQLGYTKAAADALPIFASEAKRVLGPLAHDIVPLSQGARGIDTLLTHARFRTDSAFASLAHNWHSAIAQVSTSSAAWVEALVGAGAPSKWDRRVDFKGRDWTIDPADSRARPETHVQTWDVWVKLHMDAGDHATVLHRVTRDVLPLIHGSEESPLKKLHWSMPFYLALARCEAALGRAKRARKRLRRATWQALLPGLPLSSFLQAGEREEELVCAFDGSPQEVAAAGEELRRGLAKVARHLRDPQPAGAPSPRELRTTIVRSVLPAARLYGGYLPHRWCWLVRAYLLLAKVEVARGGRAAERRARRNRRKAALWRLRSERVLLPAVEATSAELVALHAAGAFVAAKASDHAETCRHAARVWDAYHAEEAELRSVANGVPIDEALLHHMGAPAARALVEALGLRGLAAHALGQLDPAREAEAIREPLQKLLDERAALSLDDPAASDPNHPLSAVVAWRDECLRYMAALDASPPASQEASAPDSSTPPAPKARPAPPPAAPTPWAPVLAIAAPTVGLGASLMGRSEAGILVCIAAIAGIALVIANPQSAPAWLAAWLGAGGRDDGPEPLG